MKEYAKDFIEINEKKISSVLILFFVLDVLVFRQIAGASGAKSAFLYFLPVGQGDSELAILPGGVKMLVDGGPPDSSVLNGLDKIFSPRDRYIDMVIMTHPQQDHFGGLVEVLRRYKIGVFIWNGETGDNPAVRDLLSVVYENKIPNLVLAAGDGIKYGGSQMKVLWPQSHIEGKININEDALIFDLESGGMKALFTGDAGEETESEILKVFPESVDVLKVGHHGSKFSSSEDFLSVIRPKVAVIEVGKNTYGHPTAEALNRLADAGAKIFRTDKDGLIKLESSIGALKILKME
ncbi:MAG: MBL fold metallo-hydrolase [Minisyncoccia bacterium]